MTAPPSGGAVLILPNLSGTLEGPVPSNTVSPGLQCVMFGPSVLMAMPACAKQIVAGNNIESRRQVAIKRHVVLRAGLRRSGRGVQDEDEQRARAANARLTRVFPRLTTASVFLTSVSGKPESQ